MQMTTEKTQWGESATAHRLQRKHAIDQWKTSWVVGNQANEANKSRPDTT